MVTCFQTTRCHFTERRRCELCLTVTDSHPRLVCTRITSPTWKDWKDVETSAFFKLRKGELVYDSQWKSNMKHHPVMIFLVIYWIYHLMDAHGMFFVASVWLFPLALLDCDQDVLHHMSSYSHLHIHVAIGMAPLGQRMMKQLRMVLCLNHA